MIEKGRDQKCSYIVQAEWPRPLSNNRLNKKAKQETEFIITAANKLKESLKTKHDCHLLGFGRIYVAKDHKEWKHDVLKILQQIYEKNSHSMPSLNDIMRDMKKYSDQSEKLKSFILFIMDLVSTSDYGVLQTYLEIDESKALKNHITYLTKKLELEEIWIEESDETMDSTSPKDFLLGMLNPIFQNTSPKERKKVNVVNSEKRNPQMLSVWVYDGDDTSRVKNRIRRELKSAGVADIDKSSLDLQFPANVIDCFSIKDDELHYGSNKWKSQSINFKIGSSFRRNSGISYL